MLRLTLALAILAPGLARAAWHEHWIATSTTAMSITGDIMLFDDRMVFSTGASLPIKKINNIAFTDDIGALGPATVYQISTPADPVLLRGNRICGKAIDYVVIWRPKPSSPGQAAERAFAAYSGAAPGPTTDKACGTFRYEIAK